MLLGLVIPLPAVLLIGNQLDFSFGALPIVVCGMFAVAGLALGLTHEKLVLDFAKRKGEYQTVLAGVRKHSRSFSFDDVVGCLVLDLAPTCYVQLLYRDSNGKLAEHIQIAAFSSKEEAMAEATETTGRLGGHIYFKEDLEKLRA